jgi:CHAT domain-containing protein
MIGKATAVLLAAAALAWAGAPARPAEAQPLKNVGDEVVLGKNKSGEDCRLRFVGSQSGSDRFSLFCEGWTQASGDIRRFRAGPQFTAERLLTDSSLQKGFETRLACGVVEPSTLASGTAAALRECKRLDGGWKMLVVAVVIPARAVGYGLETFPTNLPLLEMAVEALEGKRRLDQPGTPPLSAAIRRAETMVGATGRLIGVQDVGAHVALYRLGEAQNWQAHYPESEASFRRLLEIEERLQGKNTPQAGVILAWIALNVGNQSRFAEADQIYARAEPLVTASLAFDDVPRYLSFRSLTELRRGKPEAQLAYAEAAMRAYEQRGAESTGVGYGALNVAMAQHGLNRLPEAEANARRAIDILEKPGPRPEFRLWWSGEAYMHLGRILTDQKRYADARKAFNAAVERRRLQMGDSVRTDMTLRELGRLGMVEGNLPAALGAFRQAAAIEIRDRPTRERTRADYLAGYLDALLASAAATPAERETLHAEAFTAVQIPRGGETARAISNMSARLDAADPAIRAVAREYQEATRERDRLRQALSAETMREPGERKPGAEEALKRDIRAAEEKVARLEERLQAELPRYAQLTAARPVPAAEISGLLKPGEAMIAFLPTREATYVVALHGSRAHAHRAAIPLADLSRAVQSIRATLEPTDGGQLRPFDTATAQRLHDLLLAPAAGALQGATQLVVVPAGPLLSLPLALLVTKPTAASADPAQVPWLARDVAISTVPAVSSLRELRQVARGSVAPRPFIGFGDPAFAGAPGDTRSMKAMADLCRDGAPVDADMVRGLPRLRETARELTLISRALGGDPASVVLGADASEAKVRATDLAQYRVVAFATHGLLPGELKCKAEPALALTPPATASAAEDGLLDAGEVAQLKLDADWVVLSACNTAGPDGKLGGESLSGLARAFFYAGARALLVSHWAVASQATVALTTATFDAQAKDATLGRAEALRRAQLALAGEKDTAHPFYWAAFTLVGDGGAPARP